MASVIEMVESSAAKNDWYGILQVDRWASEEAIRRQYKKLALLLHPDKNANKGAESAFKLVGKAYEYLMERSSFFVANRGDTNNEKESGKEANQDRCPQSEGQEQDEKPFWSECPSCTWKFQYAGMYKNRWVACPHCTKPFFTWKLHKSPVNSNTKIRRTRVPVTRTTRAAGSNTKRKGEKTGGTEAAKRPRTSTQRQTNGTQSKRRKTQPKEGTWEIILSDNS